MQLHSCTAKCHFTIHVTKLIPTGTPGGMGRNKAVPSVSSNNVGLDPIGYNITKEDKDISTVSKYNHSSPLPIFVQSLIIKLSYLQLYHWVGDISYYNIKML